MELRFSGPVFHWRGPSPYYFVAVPADDADALEGTSSLVSYGWGMIPATVRVGETTWTTALWPKDGAYVVPLKLSVRRAESFEEGDTIDVRLTVEA